MNQWMEKKIGIWKKKEDGREARGCRKRSCGWHSSVRVRAQSLLTLCAAAGLRGPQSGAQSTAAGGLQAAPALQLEGDAPSSCLGLKARYHLRLGQRVHEHACKPEGADVLSTLPDPCYLPSPAPGLTIHRLGLRVVVGEPSPQAETGSLGVGPDTRVSERQWRPAGGAVQAGHGAHPA